MPMYKCKLFMRDAFGRETTRSAQVNATDPVAADVMVGLWAADVQAATKLLVFKHVTYIENELSGSPAAGANVDAGMTISVLLADGVKKASIQLPDPVGEIVNADASIDLSNSIVTDLEDNYTTNVYISDGELSDHFIKGRLDV